MRKTLIRKITNNGVALRSTPPLLAKVTTPFGPYGGLRPSEEAASQDPTRLQNLGSQGDSSPEYDQFIEERARRRSSFAQDNKTIVHQTMDINMPNAVSKWSCMDANQATAHASYAVIDTAFLFPITPSTPMGEIVDEWSANGLLNCFGQKVSVTEMQSEGGAAGALHGALKAGALASTYTASQGLLLMIPNMYKICGELLPCVIHVSARSLARHALSIFGDHSDIIAVRQTGWTMICSETVQMAMDMSLLSHMATIDSRVPILHFFDGFRTSHEINKIRTIDYKDIKSIMPWDKIQQHHQMALSPMHPHMQGTSQGPDVFFQAGEANNTHFDKVSSVLEKWAEKVRSITGRTYAFYAYEGSPTAENIVVIMGSGAITTSETVKYLNNKGSNIGVLKIRLYRPWCADMFLQALPPTVKRIAVLDRCKDDQALGDPLFIDVSATIKHSPKHQNVEIIGGRYGLGSKDFTPAQVKAIFDNLQAPNPKTSFTVGINDDVTHLSIPVGEEIDILPEGTRQCLFYGLGSDGTVGANKTAIKLIANNTDMYAQGYFQYDAKKSGGITISHLRFGPKEVNAPYYVLHADYIAIHKANYVKRYDMIKRLKTGGVVVLNCTWTKEELDRELPARMKRQLAEKKAKFFTINATKVGIEVKVGKMINMIMQSIFFKLADVLQYEKAAELLKKDIKKMYGKKGDEIVKRNYDAVDKSLPALQAVEIPASWANAKDDGWSAIKAAAAPMRNPTAPTHEITQDYVNKVVAPINALEGDDLPVSAFEPGGRVPNGTSASEKRGIAIKIPQVDMDKCTQCNYCSLVCPHAAIRPFLLTDDEVAKAPKTVKDTAKPAIGGGALDKYKYRIQVSPLDCTGCELCVRICPADALKFQPPEKMVPAEQPNWMYCINLPNRGNEIDATTVKGSQFQQPFLEFSGACEGCGETPHVKLLTQLFGNRLVVANATGCSSIWGASMPSFPYTTNVKGEGPAWANSLFEDNAEFGFGMRRAYMQRRSQFLIAVDDAMKDTSVKMSDRLRALIQQWDDMRHGNKHDMMLIKGKSVYHALYEKIVPLLDSERKSHPKLEQLYTDREFFTRFSHWIIGGDGWAYDIGFGGLDHILASEEHVKVMILDTEMYSNTGGQASKSTPVGALAKFAEMGKITAKKDFGQYAMQYRSVYVGSISIHANHQHAVRTLLEAEAYPGPAVVLCYSPCISQGFPMSEVISHCRQAVATGYWPLYRYNPELRHSGNNPFQLESRKISGDLMKFLSAENRFASVMRKNPAIAKELDNKLQQELNDRQKVLTLLNEIDLESGTTGAAKPAGSADNMVTILYGSETGNSEEQAKSLFFDLKARDIPATLSSLDEFEFKELPNQKMVVIVCSTCGLGEFPANSRNFWKKLQDTTLPMSFLSKTKFTVFGLGDSTYSQFCHAASAIDVRMSELGATRVLNRGIGDDRCEDRFYTGWDQWIPELWKTLKAPSQPIKREIPKAVFKVEIRAGDPKRSAVDNDALIPPGATALTLEENRRLTPPGNDRDIRHYQFNVAGTNIKYSVGDSLAVYPRFSKEKVDAFCKMYGVDPNQEMRIVATGEARNKIPEELSVRQLFAQVLDIFGKPNRRFFDSICTFATNAEERKKLEMIASSDNDEGKKLLRGLMEDFTNHADVFAMFPSCRPPLEQLMNIIPMIKPRSYSISSDPEFQKGKLTLSIVEVDWIRPSTGEKRHGECTSYLKPCAAGTKIMCQLRPSAIVLPKDDMTPIIMCGMGTGLAPWRALTQHRVMLKKQGKKVGPCVLYYGARFAKSEYLYREEFEEYIKMGVLNMRTAFSRDQAHKIYVQHRIEEDAEMLHKYLMKDGGYFYVCGSARQVPEDVYNAMKRVMMKAGHLNEADADAALSSLRMEGRYTVEAWS